VENDQAIQAIEFFEKTKQTGLLKEQPNEMNRDQIKSIQIIHLCAINGLAQLGMASMAESISQDFPSSLLDNVFIQNALIDMWVSRDKCAHSS
jgi:hypothetical protein